MSLGRQLLQHVMDAHGGQHRWSAINRIDATLSTGGFAFVTRFQGGRINALKIHVYPHESRVVIRDYPSPGYWGEWCGNTVQVGLEEQPPHITRTQARQRFSGWLSQPRWDDLDLLYFAGYAIWNYLSFPFLLAHKDVTVTEHTHPKGYGGPLLQAQFGPALATHCARQTFQLDGQALLRRHDYVAEVFGRWASAANFCQATEVVGGLRFYTRRRVLPALGLHAALPFPTLVWIEVQDLQVHTLARRVDTASLYPQVRA